MLSEGPQQYSVACNWTGVLSLGIPAKFGASQGCLLGFLGTRPQAIEQRARSTRSSSAGIVPAALPCSCLKGSTFGGRIFVITSRPFRSRRRKELWKGCALPPYFTFIVYAALRDELLPDLPFVARGRVSSSPSDSPSLSVLSAGELMSSANCVNFSSVCFSSSSVCSSRET